MTAVVPDGKLITTVSARAAANRSPARRVVVGVDGSPGSLAALRWAAAEAARRGAPLRIVCAWDPAGNGAGSAASLAAATVQDALDFVVCLDGRLESVSCVAPEGEPGKVLVEQASGAAMLILGAASTARFGDITRHCLRFARCPLVFVRP